MARSGTGIAYGTHLAYRGRGIMVSGPCISWDGAILARGLGWHGSCRGRVGGYFGTILAGGGGSGPHPGGDAGAVDRGLFNPIPPTPKDPATPRAGEWKGSHTLLTLNSGTP